MITKMAMVTGSAVLLLAGASGTASAYHPANATYGECVSSYNSGDRALWGTPGQNRYPNAQNPLPANQVARLRNEARKEHCSSAKNSEGQPEAKKKKAKAS